METHLAPTQVDDKLRTFAKNLVEAAAEAIRPHYRSTLEILEKSDESPVTVADRSAETAMRKLIEAHYPDHGILGEEYGEINPQAEYRWVLDPIDGTKSFILGIPMFVTLVALERRGVPILGLANQPILNQCLIGDGDTTTLNGEPVSVRPCGSLGKARLLTPDHLMIEQHQAAAPFEKLIRSVKSYRCIGDGYAYTLLATGFVDAVVDPIMFPWDLAALIPIIRGAGGTITTWQGDEAVGANSAIAASRELHPALAAALNP